MTLTLEIPEDLAPRFAAMPESERPNFALAAIRTVVHQEEIEPAEGEDLDELIAAVNEGLDAIKAGEKGLTPEELDVRLKTKFPFLRSHTDQQENTARVQDRTAA